MAFNRLAAKAAPTGITYRRRSGFSREAAGSATEKQHSETGAL